MDGCPGLLLLVPPKPPHEQAAVAALRGWALAVVSRQAAATGAGPEGPDGSSDSMEVPAPLLVEALKVGRHPASQPVKGGKSDHSDSRNRK